MVRQQSPLLQEQWLEMRIEALMDQWEQGACSNSAFLITWQNTKWKTARREQRRDTVAIKPSRLVTVVFRDGCGFK